MKICLAVLILLIVGCALGQDKADTLATMDSCTIYIPNLVTMNCETGEDYQFQAVSNCAMQEFQIRIYNRWGELLFESIDINSVWDARKQEQGTYIYTLCGTSISGQNFDFRGHLTVLK